MDWSERRTQRRRDDRGGGIGQEGIVYDLAALEKAAADWNRRRRPGAAARPGQRPRLAGARYSFDAAGHRLALHRPRIDARLRRAVEEGPLEVALIDEADVLVLAYRLGGAPAWDRASYNWHLVPGSLRALPPDEDAAALPSPLWVSLVGADDGVVHARRGVMLPTSFARALHRTIRAQASRPFDSLACVRAVAGLAMDGEVEALLPRAVARAGVR